MTDDPLDLLTRPTTPLDDERFTRAVLRRARVAAGRRPWRTAAAAAAACALAMAVAIATGPALFALAAVAAITWAMSELGGR